MAIKKNPNKAGLSERGIELVRYLVDDLTIGPDVLDRAFFYNLSSGLSKSELVKVRSSVRERALRFYEDVQKEHVSLGGELEAGEWQNTERFVEKMLNHWFNPWTRLAGAIESEIDYRKLSLSPEQFDEKTLSSVLMKYSRLDEYKPYLDREFKGFVSNKCLDYGLDYSMMAPELRTPELLKKWEEDYPYLMESKEWDILSMAYKAGGPRKMTLQEEPDLSNGFIGGDTSWSSFLNVVHGPVLKDGKVTGLGQIDYKDCTNTFVILDGDRKAVFFDGLSKQQKHSVLERVFDTLKYSKKYQLKNKSVGGPKL